MVIIQADAEGPILENSRCPTARCCYVENGQQVQRRARCLCKWDPAHDPIIAEDGGKVRFDEIVEGETLRKERDTRPAPSAGSSWSTRATCTRRSSSRTTAARV